MDFGVLLEPNAMKCVMKIRENYIYRALGVGIVLEIGARSQIFWSECWKLFLTVGIIYRCLEYV